MTPTAGSTAIVFPNPAPGPGPVTIVVPLSAPADRVEIRVFTTAFRLVNEIQQVNVPAGIDDVALPLTDRWGQPLSNGLYYVVARTPQRRFILKLLVLR